MDRGSSAVGLSAVGLLWGTAKEPYFAAHNREFGQGGKGGSGGGRKAAKQLAWIWV
jgi:hypothetical protein